MQNNSLVEKNFKDTLIVQIWRLLGMIALGLLAGYLVSRTAKKNDDSLGKYYFLTIFLLFLIIGLVVFIVNVVKAYKHLKKEKTDSNITKN